MNNGNKVIKIVPILVVLIIVISYLWGWQINVFFHKDNVALDISELIYLVSEDIDAGYSNGTYYVKNIDETQLQDINNYITSLNGSINHYSLASVGLEGKRLMLTFDISNNYYVLRKYKTGEEIPPDRPEAFKLYEKVVEIIDTQITPEMKDYQKELAIHDYIVANCEYGFNDYSKDYAYRAYGALVQGVAVCNGYAEAMSLLLSCVDIENDMISGTADGVAHAWNLVKIGGEWYQVDATWNDPLPDRNSFVGHVFFNVTDDMMDDTHIWEEDNYVSCDTLSYNYFVYNNDVTDFNRMNDTIKRKISSEITKENDIIFEVAIKGYTPAYSELQFIMEENGVFSCQTTTETYEEYTFLTVYLNQ